MIIALMLIASIVAMLQFGLSYWRSLIAGVASQPLSDRMCAAAALGHATPGAGDFSALLSLHRLTPGVESHHSNLRGLRSYYTAMDTLCRLPAMSRWAHSEKATCSRYLAVLVDQRLSANLACATEMRSC